MTAWTLDDLRRLDLKYAEEGIHVHQRPFRAAMELLGSNFVMGVGGNPEVKPIMDTYTAMVPEVSTSWPGAGSVSLRPSIRSASSPSRSYSARCRSSPGG